MGSGEQHDHDKQSGEHPDRDLLDSVEQRFQHDLSRPTVRRVHELTEAFE